MTNEQLGQPTKPPPAEAVCARCSLPQGHRRHASGRSARQGHPFEEPEADAPSQSTEAATSAWAAEIAEMYDDILDRGIHLADRCRYDADHPCTCYVGANLDAVIAARGPTARPEPPVEGALEEALGLLCVNEKRLEFTCFHVAHPDNPCPKTFAQPGGGGCGCNENVQLPQSEEDELVLKRNLPKWEWERLARLAAARSGHDELETLQVAKQLAERRVDELRVALHESATGRHYLSHTNQIADAAFTDYNICTFSACIAARALSSEA